MDARGWIGTVTEKSDPDSKSDLKPTGKDALSIEEMVSNARDARDFLKAIAHEQRLLILCILAEGEKSVGELEALLNMRQPSVSQQLARLRSEQLVTTRRVGKTIYYALASDNARELIAVLYRMFCGPKD